MNRMFAALFGLFLAVYVTSTNAADEAPPVTTDKRAAQRLKIMRGALDEFRIVLADAPETALKFSPRPLLRYNDQTRKVGGSIQGVLDATVWRLGESGRPKAIITLEIYLVDQGSPLLTYEFVSLTPRKFDMQSARGVRWMPHTTDVSMIELDEVPAPADTSKARLVQMRGLARRFTASELLRQEKINLRLLPQPLDRYDDAEAGILDGAVFVFANGTNPELGLLLERSDKRWSYGLFRLASVMLFARFDDKQLDVDWLESHWADIIPQAYGKFIAVAGQEALVASTSAEGYAWAKAAHPEDGGPLVEYVLPPNGPRIYANR